MDYELLNKLRLIRSTGIGAVTYYKLLAKYKSASIAVENINELIKAGKLAKDTKLIDMKNIEKEYKHSLKLGAKIISHQCKEYPKLLNQIDYPPPILTILGDIENLNLPCIAMVGSRNCSINASKLAFETAEELAAYFNIVSGLARGIDTQAHMGALSCNEGRSIAVTACGIDVIYPPENKKLYNDLKEKGNIITETALFAPPLAGNFPKRNRIISGLSIATIVVEADIKSGSLITARNALEQNREIFAVPGFPKDPRCRGGNHLIKNGAYLIESANDIIDILSTSSLININNKDKIKPDNKKQNLQNNNDLQNKNTNLHQLIIAKLNTTPIDIDEIIGQTGITTSNMLAILAELEMSGKITRYPGNKIAVKF